nr:MAG TPA: hypothetical protein [Caudoviricetes sp.]
MEINVTEEQFLSYERLRRSGRINMLDIANGSIITGMPEHIYEQCIFNYGELKKRYLTE